MSTWRCFLMSYLLILSTSALLAQGNVVYEEQARRFMARIGRSDSVQRYLETEEKFFVVGYQDGGRLHHSRSTSPGVVLYTNTRDMTEATRRSRTEAPRLTLREAEERVWRLLPEGASRSEWRVKETRDFQAGMDERCGNYEVAIDILFALVPSKAVESREPLFSRLMWLSEPQAVNEPIAQGFLNGVLDCAARNPRAVDQFTVGDVGVRVLRVSMFVRPSESLADQISDQPKAPPRSMGEHHVEELVRRVGGRTRRRLEALEGSGGRRQFGPMGWRSLVFHSSIHLLL